ncbi:OmpA family protein [Snuella lapsa]
MKKIIYIVVLVFVTSFVYAQKGRVRAMENDYENFAYVKTSDVLLRVAEKGYKSVNLFEKLANSFYFNNKMEEAVKWYGELMALNEEVDPELYYRYAQALKYIERYEEADAWMQKFHELNTEDSRGKAFINNVDYLKIIENNTNDDIVLHNLSINSETSDFGTFQLNNQIVFASSRGNGRKYKWNEQPFLDLYSAEKEGDTTFTNVSNFDSNLNTKFHESTPTFTKDGKRVYFTRNNYYQGKYRKDDNNINRLKLFRATINDAGEWGNIKSIHFNSDEYSVAHPTLNPDGTRLYFASDMPGTIGQADLYVVDVNEDGSLGEPRNLGTEINTEGKETFPFMNDQGDLYFSSDGYPGLGGLDIYIIRDFEKLYQENNELIKGNLAKPINSPQDDFGFFENLSTKQVFISSNRPNGKGDDDIYTFTIPECKQTVEGLVKDKINLELLPNSMVTLFDKQGQKIKEVVVGDDAYFNFSVDCETEYLVRAEKETYTPDEKRFTTPNKSQELKLELLLEKDEYELKVGDDLAKVLDIPIIYFDFDKYNIRYDATVELQKVLEVMTEYPTMIVDIRSHTDCRGSYKYNETLSDNRAKSTRQYLIEKGIEPERLTAKGYGEYELVNNCGCEPDNYSTCSEVEHQLNRRSEFIIVKI